MLEQMMVGAIALASLLAGLFFFRFWRSSHDRFFLYFALSFWIEGLNRINSGLMMTMREDDPPYYLIRLVAYALILLAIWEKNRPRRSKS